MTNSRGRKEPPHVFFKKKKLATKLAWIIGAMLVVIFALLITAVVFFTSAPLENAISSELTQQASLTGKEVQSVFDTASAVTADMQRYLSNVYSSSQALNEEGAENTYTSAIYHVPLKPVPYLMEFYLSNTARHAVSYYSEITGVGVMFEPDMFAANIKDYAFYVDAGNATGDIAPFGDYSSYSKEEYYINAKEYNTITVTEPFDYEGTMMVSLSAPITYNDRFMGIVVVDIAISNFSQIKLDNSVYSSLYGLVLDDSQTVIYDSRSMDTVGRSLADLSGAEHAGTVNARMSSAEAFDMTMSRQDGSSTRGFFVPLTIGSERWWSMIALDVTQMNSTVRTTTLWLIILSLAALAVLVTVVVFVLRSMLRPIQPVVAAAERISAGDFDIHLESKSEDEIGILTQTFSHTAKTLQSIVQDITRVLNRVASKDLDVDTDADYVGDLVEIESSIRRILSNLNSVMLGINESAGQVSAGSEQVSSGAQALAQGAAEQASSVEELAATINEISGQVQQSASNARSANTKADETARQMQALNQQMQDLTAAMEEINSSAEEISKIIATIENIAFQTNILALNAAVEAARAGTAGKGFAVVADEVRSLANKSQEASKDTAALIERARTAVGHGTRITDETAKALLNAVDGVRSVTATIEQIFNASAAQAASIDHVTQGVDQISSVVQTNSATAEQSAAASEELSGQAQMLKDMVGEFRLRQSDTVVHTESALPPAARPTASAAEKY